MFWKGILGKGTAESSLGPDIGCRLGQASRFTVSLSSGCLSQHPAVSHPVLEENDVGKLGFCRRFII